MKTLSDTLREEAQGWPPLKQLRRAAIAFLTGAVAGAATVLIYLNWNLI